MDEEYLQSDFDYNTLKVGALRRILTENHIEFPPNARKAALKRLYEEHIIPLLPQLRKKYLHAQPSSEGIVSVEEEKRRRSERRGGSSSNRRRRRKSSSDTSTSGRKRNGDTLEKEDQEDSSQQNRRDITEIDLTSTSSPTSTDLRSDVQNVQKTRRKLANSGTSSTTSSSGVFNIDLSAASPSGEALRSPKTQLVNPVTPPSAKKRKRADSRSIGKERTPIIDKVQRKTKAYDTRESHNVQDFTISSTSSSSSSSSPSSLSSEDENTIVQSGFESVKKTINSIKDNDIDIDMDMDMNSNSASSSSSDSDSDNQVSSSPERHTSLTSAPVSAPKSSSRYQQFSTSFETYSVKPSGHFSKRVDFTYKRKPLIPELDRLSVSPEFAEHLRQTLQENDDRRRSTTVTQIDKEPSVPVPATDTAISQSQGSGSTGVLPNGDSTAASELAYRSMGSGSNLHSTPGQGLVEIVDVDVDNDNEDDSAHANSKYAKTFEVVETDSQGSDKVRYQEQGQEESTDDIISSSDESFLLDEVVTTEDSENTYSEVEDTESPKESTQEQGNATLAKPPHAFRNALCKFIKFLFKSSIFLFVFGSLIITLLFALWYRQQRILVGYCGHEVNSSIFSQTYPDNEVIRSLDSFLEDYKPSCIPCPDHSICYPYMKIKCKPEYTLRKSKWSLFGMLPVGDSCVKDDRREQLVKEVVDRSLDFLRAKNAQVSCGNGHDDISSGMSEELLYDIFQEAKATWIGNDEFDEIWEQVVEDLKNEPEIVYRQVSTWV